MQIFLALNTNFFTRDAKALRWITTYSDSLSKLGFQCVHFDGNSKLLPENAIIHFFSSYDSEMWKVLSDSGRMVLITPTLAHQITSVRTHWMLTKLDHWIRKFIFRLSNELTESVFRKSGRHYLVVSDQVKGELIRFWEVDEGRVTVLGDEPQNAALVASRIYNQLSSIK